MDMSIMFETIDMKTYLELNSKLQKKKNALRKALKEKGILKKGATNTYDRYSYFSEAQYKELFTQLFAEYGLEMKFTEIAYDTFEGSEKQANGRMPKLEFSLMDVDTGFWETTIITGEGIDKGDKAGYKAYTGALKYFLANTFMVATGDDPEKDSPSEKMNNKKTEISGEIVDDDNKLEVHSKEEADKQLYDNMKKELSELWVKAGGQAKEFNKWFADNTKNGLTSDKFASMKTMLLKKINDNAEGQK